MEETFRFPEDSPYKLTIKEYHKYLKELHAPKNLYFFLWKQTGMGLMKTNKLETSGFVVLKPTPVLILDEENFPSKLSNLWRKN